MIYPLVVSRNYGKKLRFEEVHQRYIYATFPFSIAMLNYQRVPIKHDHLEPGALFHEVWSWSPCLPWASAQAGTVYPQAN